MRKGWTLLDRKRQNQVVHCRKRICERFGRDITKQTYRKWIAQIESGEATFIREDDAASRWLIETRLFGRITVVYDKETRVIVTALPLRHTYKHMDKIEASEEVAMTAKPHLN